MTRNVLCGKYRECLDLAVKNNQAWDCHGCEYEKEISYKSILDLEGCIMLLFAIFRPNLFKKIRERETLEKLSRKI